MIGAYAIGEVSLGGLKPLGYTAVTLRLLLRLAVQARTSSILSGIPAACPPLNYALTPDNELFMANGLMPMQKWNGLRYQAWTVGVLGPVNAPVLSSSGAGSLTGTYAVYQRFVDFDGNPSNLSPASNLLTIDRVAQLTVSGLDLPAETKVARRQILRNLSGEGLTFYIEVDSTDLAATSFNLTLSDDDLASQESIPLFDSEQNQLANIHGIPPSFLSVVAPQQGRMFATGDTPYSVGAVEVTNGSTSVQGVGTAWTTAMEGRLLYITGEVVSYTITTVNPLTQTLTLATAFLGGTDLFATYAVRSQPSNKNLVYYTEAGQYDSWPADNSLQVEETGDDNTALIPNESFLFIGQKRHTYRLSFLHDPGADGGAFLAYRRGVVNQRCWVLVDGKTYAMDEEGIYRSQGNNVEPISATVQDLFWADRSDPTAPRINWEAQCHFHAQLHRDETTIRWFVALSGARLPRHALAFNYRTEQWWIEELPSAVGGSDLWPTRPVRPILAAACKKVYAQGIGTTDGPDPKTGTTRGTVTSATLDTFTDSLAAFPARGVVGEPVTIFLGTGKTQVRTIVAVSGTTLRVDQPWTVALDTTSHYQLGAVNWQWRGGWYRWLNEESDINRRIEAVFEPCSSEANMDIRLYRDHARTPVVWAQDYPTTTKEDVGVKITKGSTDIEVDLSFNRGSCQVRMQGHRDQYLQQADFVSLHLRGVSAENPIRVYEVALEGAVGPGR